MPFWRPRGCVLWLDFLEPSGNMAYDKSGYGNHGTIHGAQRVRSLGRWGLEFDGVDDYVEVPFSSSLDFGGITDLTVEMLCLLRSKDAERYTGRENQFLIGYDSIDDSWAWWLYIGGAWTGLRGLEKTFTPKTGEWVHLCGVYDGSEMRMYVNGELDRSKARTGGLNDVDTMIAIGRRGETDRNYWDGLIALVRIYNRALTEREVKANYAYFFSHLKGEV